MSSPKSFSQIHTTITKKNAQRDSAEYIERLEVRTTMQAKSDMVEAARLSGLTLTAFTRLALDAAARDIIHKHEITRLSAEDHEAFFHAMQNPPAPTKRLSAKRSRYSGECRMP